MSVLVIGSVNADVVLRTRRLPRSGETVRASDIATFPGGKGANQAVAAARMGAAVKLVARVGADAAGTEIVEALRADGVEVSVTVDAAAATGRALITVADDGANTIVTVGGANHRLGTAEIATFERLVGRADVVLVQLEIPMAVVQAAVAAATAAGVPVVCDPAPVAELSDELYRCAAWMTPNEHEAAELTGKGDPQDAARELADRGVDNVAVTIGERGCLYVGLDGTYEIGAPDVEAVDTVACGDAFSGALAARISAGDSPREALRWAVAAGAAAATRAGAYPSLPLEDQARSLLTS